MVIKGYSQNHEARLAHYLLGLILVFYLLNVIFYIRAQSITSDEGSFLYYSVRLLKGHPERIHPETDNSKMPICVINLLPRVIEQLSHPGLTKTDFGNSDIITGRYITMLVSIFTILIVFRWSKELYGIWAGVFSAFLISFCPNMLANAGFVTTDSYSMLFLTLTMYCLWKFCNAPSFKYFVLFCFCISLSQLVKQSLTYLYTLVPLCLCGFYIVQRPLVRWKTALLYFFVFVFINWLVINLGFYFKDTNTSLENYHFSSIFFIKLQHFLPTWLPVPFPKAFITGLDLSKYYDQIGGGNKMLDSFGKVTILGNSSASGGFWYYYIVSIIFKTPIVSMILIAAGLLTMIRSQSINGFFKNEFFLLLPVFFFLILMSFFYNTQIGIRHIIFIYPLLYIICGNLFKTTNGIYKKTVMVSLSAILIISVLRYWSNYYPYTNEFILDKKSAYRYVGASNLEFHQGNLFFSKYLDEHPEVKPASTVPEQGTFLIDVNDYLDIWNTHKYEWISHIKPTGEVAYNGLLITVTSQDIEQIHKTAQTKY